MLPLSLFIFRQDLRLQDNRGLLRAISTSEKVFPIFIHDDRARKDFGENDARFWLVREALESIDTELQKENGRLTVYQGNPEEIIKKLLETYPITGVFINTSYSPRGKKRDATIRALCEAKSIHFESVKDFLLVEPEEVPVRKVFTPFSKLWNKELHDVSVLPHIYNFSGANTHHLTRWFTPNDRIKISDIISVPHHPFWTVWFGKTRLLKDYTLYDETRNIPWWDGTTRFSPYIRFGILSIREVFRQVQNIPTIRNELAWREFWYHIAHHFPEIYTSEFQEKRRNIAWENNSILQNAIEKAETGFPLVDAGLKQLYTTHWMHNRVRMVVASFITKNCRIDWRWGEALFKKYLIDYDEAVNIGNWQWSASVGADPKPVRIFNPLLQSKRFDEDAKYIKKYLPELISVAPKDIHTLSNLPDSYPKPIVDQKESASEAKKLYKESSTFLCETE